jgi:Cu2+-exporting ATPase
MVSDAAATKAPIAKIADRVSGVFVPTVIILALVTIAVWLIAGESAAYALERGISVLVISCPCALGLATPVAIMAGSGIGAKNGILFKNATALEQTGKTEIAVLDKTGTITKGEPSVTDIIPAEGITSDELIKTAFSLEHKSEHPLAKAIIKYAAERNFTADEVTSFEALRGSGLAAEMNGEKHIAGNLRLAETYCDIPDKMRKIAEKLSEQGKTPLFFCRSACGRNTSGSDVDKRELIGIIAVADTIKDDSREAIAALKNMGIRTVMLTGDNERTAKAIGEIAGVDEVIAGVLPDGKEAVIRSLKKQGRTAMIGDGINDAPALTRADIGIAIGAGSDIAIDAADVVLMKSRITDAAAAIRLSRSTLRNIKQNLFWAFFYNVIGIPLAAGIWIPLFGWRLSPMFAAAAMSLSSFCVVTNALRLNLVNIFSAKHDRKIKHTKHKEEISMEATLKIEGMMCGHCEATVKKALEALSTVDEAEVSHKDGTAKVKLNAATAPEVLKKAVEDKEYTVTEVIM